jgi:hypothetical protein
VAAAKASERAAAEQVTGRPILRIEKIVLFIAVPCSVGVELAVNRPGSENGGTGFTGKAQMR